MSHFSFIPNMRMWYFGIFVPVMEFSDNAVGRTTVPWVENGSTVISCTSSASFEKR